MQIRRSLFIQGCDAWWQSNNRVIQNFYILFTLETDWCHICNWCCGINSSDIFCGVWLIQNFNEEPKSELEFRSFISMLMLHHCRARFSRTRGKRKVNGTCKQKPQKYCLNIYYKNEQGKSIFKVTSLRKSTQFRQESGSYWSTWGRRRLGRFIHWRHFSFCHRHI